MGEGLGLRVLPGVHYFQGLAQPRKILKMGGHVFHIPKGE